MESANELMSSFEDHYDVIQNALNHLIHNNDDLDLINSIFRSIHTVKGNAAMMQVNPLVVYVHGIEDTITAMRSGHFRATPILCDLILTAMDRLKDLHIKYLFEKEITPFDEDAIARLFNEIAVANNSTEVDALCEELKSVFSPPEPSQNEVNPNDTNSVLSIDFNNIADPARFLTLTDQQCNDLRTFREFSLRVDEQNHYWRERTDLIAYLGLVTASTSDTPLDLVQLLAAIYMHDVGMAFVPEEVVNKTTRLNPMETKKLHHHPVWGFELLSRMSGWGEAAEIVLQHHERMDGQGYPNGLAGDDIHMGAKILAILDAYYAMTHLRADRSHRRSVMRAISEVNACVDSQFDRDWVGVFNQVIRLEAKAGVLF